MRRKLSEQVIAIMGGSSGIGRQTAIDFAREGARVVIAARSQEGLGTLADEITSRGGDVSVVVADTTSPEQVQAVVDTAVRQHGRLDTWVQCAAVSIYATAEQTNLEEYRRILEVNLLGTVIAARAALPALKQAGDGALICISSVEAFRPIPLQAAYGMSKHGVHCFLDVLRMELEHEGAGVTVTEIMPAAIDTPFFDKARTKMGVAPTGFPPIYPADRVARAIVKAARRPPKQRVVGGAGKALLALQRLAPRLLDRAIERTAFRMQKTAVKKGPNAPTNLYAPLDDFEKVEGEATRAPRPPLLVGRGRMWAAAGLGVAAVGLLAARRR